MKFEAEIVGGADPDETAAIMAAVDHVVREMTRAARAPQRPDAAGVAVSWRSHRHSSGAGGYRKRPQLGSDPGADPSDSGSVLGSR